MGLFSSLTDPLGIHKKTRKAIGIKQDPGDPFGHIKKLEHSVSEELGLDFEKFHFKQIWKDLMRNPGRILYGSFDPFSTKMWNEALGTDYDPIINQLGGATNQRFVDYVEAGGDPKLAEKAARNHQIAATVASIYAGGALAGAAGGAGGAAAGAGGAGASTVGGLTAAMPSAATFSAGLSGTGALATAGVAAGSAEMDAEFEPEFEEQPLISRPGSLSVGNVPTWGRGYAEGGALHMATGGKSYVGNWKSNKNKGLRLYDLMAPWDAEGFKVKKGERKRRKKAVRKQERGHFGDEIVTGIKNPDKRRAMVRAGWYADTPSDTRRGVKGAEGKKGRKYTTSLNKNTTFYPPESVNAFGGAGPTDYFRRSIVRRDPASYISGGAEGGLMVAAQPRARKNYRRGH